MAERICLMTFCSTDCKDNCFNCECGGAEATKDMYVSINNVQRVCAITGGAADTDEGEYVAEVIRNNLENMVMPAADVQPVKHGHWEDCSNGWMCSCCERDSTKDTPFCPNCGAKMSTEWKTNFMAFETT